MEPQLKEVNHHFLEDSQILSSNLLKICLGSNHKQACSATQTHLIRAKLPTTTITHSVLVVHNSQLLIHSVRIITMEIIPLAITVCNSNKLHNRTIIHLHPHHLKIACLATNLLEVASLVIAAVVLVLNNSLKLNSQAPIHSLVKVLHKCHNSNQYLAVQQIHSCSNLQTIIQS